MVDQVKSFKEIIGDVPIIHITDLGAAVIEPPIYGPLLKSGVWKVIGFEPQQDEYEKLASEKQNFTYHLVLSEPTKEDLEGGWPKGDPVKTNFLFRAFEEGQLKQMDEPENCLYYVCGPPLHNSSILKLLDDYGVPKENIILDDFGS